MDLIEVSVNLDRAVQIFGAYLKYCVVQIPSQPVIATKNAFTILMQSQKALQQRSKLPSKKQCHNKKDALFNDLIDYLDQNKLYFTSEADTLGANLVRALCDLLWCIDGHHDTLKQQQCPVPKVFSKFIGYNIPEMSKHRKRSITNISSDYLKPIVSSLFSILQSSYWKKESWKKFYDDVQALTGSMHQYTDYLDRQSKKVAVRHSSTVPVRTMGDAISVKYIKSTTIILPILRPLNATVSAMEDYTHFFLNDILDTDSKKRYNFLQCLTDNGLYHPIVMCTHSSGNNKGNLHFVWRVPNKETTEDAFSSSQKVIKSIRPSFPIFHTRAMRKEMFSKFGRVAPSIRPSILRHFYHELTGDSSAANCLDESEIDARVAELLSMEPDNPKTISDLREVKHPEHKTKYEVFWKEAKKILDEGLGTAVDDR